MWIFVLLLIILLILFILSIIPLVIQLALTSIPVWGVGICVGLIAFFSLRQHLLISLRSPEKLAALVELDFDGKRLNCHIQSSEMDKYANTKLPYGLFLLSCIVTTLIVLLILAGTGAFDGHSFSMMDIGGRRDSPTYFSRQTVLIFIALLSCVPIAYAYATLKSKQSLSRSVGEEVERLVAGVNLSLKQTDDLKSVLSQISSLTARAKIKFPETSTTSIRSYIESHKAELLVNTSGLDRLLGIELARAKDDSARLVPAINLYENAMSIYVDVSRGVNRTGSMPLIKELEYSYAGLTHGDLKSLLAQRRWSEFHDIVNAIIKDLQRQKDVAVKYEQHEEKYGEFEEEETYFTETDEEKAYRILGAPATATDEQIKKLYKKLASVYHPDTSVINNDERFKEINWAYGVLKAARNII